MSRQVEAKWYRRFPKQVGYYWFFHSRGCFVVEVSGGGLKQDGKDVKFAIYVGGYDSETMDEDGAMTVVGFNRQWPGERRWYGPLQAPEIPKEFEI